MEKGYVVTSDPSIYWSEKPVRFAFWKAEVIVAGRFRLLPANAEAYRCRNCKIVLFSYGKKEF